MIGRSSGQVSVTRTADCTPTGRACGVWRRRASGSDDGWTYIAAKLIALKLRAYSEPHPRKTTAAASLQSGSIHRSRPALSGGDRPGQRLRRLPQPAGREAGLKRAGGAAPHPKMRVNTAPLVRQCRRKAYPALNPHDPSEAPLPPASSTARLNRTSASSKRASPAFWSIPRCSAICSTDIPAKRWRTKMSRQRRGSRGIARARTRRSGASSSNCDGGALTNLPRCRSLSRPPQRSEGCR